MISHFIGLIVSNVCFVSFIVYLVKTEQYIGQSLTIREMWVMLVIASLFSYFSWSVVIDLVEWLI